MYQAKVLLQSKDDSQVMIGVAHHALKSALERLGGIHEEREHIHG